MSTPQWPAEPSVIDRLVDAPQRFQFFQAVHLLELWLCQSGISADCALSEYLQFQNNLSLNFPAGEIVSLALRTNGRPLTAAQWMGALQNGQTGVIVMTPTFMGYLGVGGVLPLHYTERIAAFQQASKEEGARAFLDIYMTRALALFYKAGKRYRIEALRDANDADGYLPLLLMLAGLTPLSAAGNGGVAAETLAFYSGLIRQRCVTGAGMAAMLEDYFRVPFTVIEFDGCWDAIPPPERLLLGGERAAALGRGALLGERHWVRDRQVRIRIGPLNRTGFGRFAPNGAAAAALRHLLGALSCAPLRFRIQLTLRRQDVNGISLGAPEKALGLGRDAYLRTVPETVDRGDLQYDLCPW